MRGNRLLISKIFLSILIIRPLWYSGPGVTHHLLKGSLVLGYLFQPSRLIVAIAFWRSLKNPWLTTVYARRISIISEKNNTHTPKHMSKNIPKHTNNKNKHKTTQPKQERNTHTHNNNKVNTQNTCTRITTKEQLKTQQTQQQTHTTNETNTSKQTHANIIKQPNSTTQQNKKGKTHARKENQQHWRQQNNNN